MQPNRTAGMLLFGCGIALASADAQRVSDTRTGIERVVVADSSPPRRDTIVATRPHPVGNRIAAGLSAGVGLGIAGLHTNICDGRRCYFGWSGIAGYWVGTVVGPALVPARRCSFSRRLGRSLLGAVPGTALALGVAAASQGSRDFDAAAATTVVALAPIIGSTIALHGCD